MNHYYIASPEHMDVVYGSGEIVCIDAREVRRLAREWDMDPEELFSQFHEADEDEIAEYGVYDTPLTDAEFSTLWTDALTVSDRDAYVSDWALSTIWGDSEGVDIPEGRLAYLSSLWAAAHMSVRDICNAARLTQRGLAQRFCIPQRTVESWCSTAASSRTCPDYVRRMMIECLGLLPAQNATGSTLAPVVRCRDCRWRNTKCCPYMNFDAVARDDDDYCSDGERM